MLHLAAKKRQVSRNENLKNQVKKETNAGRHNERIKQRV